MVIEAVMLDLGAVYSWGMGSGKQLGHGDDEDDVEEPKVIRGKQLDNRYVNISFCIFYFAFLSFA